MVASAPKPAPPATEKIKILEVPDATLSRQLEFLTVWKLSGQENGYDWFQLIDPTKPTGFIVVQGYDWTFRSLGTHIKDFRLKDGSIKTFLVDSEKNEEFLLIKEPSTFSESTFPKCEYEKIGKCAVAFQYRPYRKKPIEIAVGRRK